MIEKEFLNALLEEYKEFMPANMPLVHQRTAVLIAFRFAIPKEEFPEICQLLMESGAEEIYKKYQFYISRPFRDALIYILQNQRLPVAEAIFGLKDARQQTIKRIRSTKQNERFIDQQHKRLERIEKNLIMLQNI